MIENLQVTNIYNMHITFLATDRTEGIATEYAWPFNLKEISDRNYMCFSPAYATQTLDICMFSYTALLPSFSKQLSR